MFLPHKFSHTHHKKVVVDHLNFDFQKVEDLVGLCFQILDMNSDVGAPMRVPYGRNLTLHCSCFQALIEILPDRNLNYLTSLFLTLLLRVA